MEARSPSSVNCFTSHVQPATTDRGSEATVIKAGSGTVRQLQHGALGTTFVLCGCRRGLDASTKAIRDDMRLLHYYCKAES